MILKGRKKRCWKRPAYRIMWIRKKMTSEGDAQPELQPGFSKEINNGSLLAINDIVLRIYRFSNKTEI
ncbi:hypothetical protein RJ53_10130 [Methanocalculus chunghsingensis]|uniref:Uncharacterized protein n=1 Tax=Methanocalculus chunghsingensis TaxID=156457 RepID=A0A8J7WBR0_9EURY|nr:hypothetical protein [Methanocalculus chunghsingensis]